jgi:hypothetical protein
MCISRHRTHSWMPKENFTGYRRIYTRLIFTSAISPAWSRQKLLFDIRLRISKYFHDYCYDDWNHRYQDHWNSPVTRIPIALYESSLTPMVPSAKTLVCLIHETGDIHSELSDGCDFEDNARDVSVYFARPIELRCVDCDLTFPVLPITAKYWSVHPQLSNIYAIHSPKNHFECHLWYPIDESAFDCHFASSDCVRYTD